LLQLSPRYAIGVLPIHSAVIQSDSIFDHIIKVISSHNNIFPSSNFHPHIAIDEIVVEDIVSRKFVVKVYGRHSVPRSKPQNVLKSVTTYDIPPPCPIPSHIPRTTVCSLLHDIMDVIIFKNVIISSARKSLMRSKGNLIAHK